MALANTNSYTIEDIYALPEGRRAELIDGRIYHMAPSSTTHQRIVTRLSSLIDSHIQQKHGSCEVFVAPFAVFLNDDNRNYVEPDISVICDKDKLDDHGCHGAPDWIIEITSPNNPQHDYGIKLFKYRTAGVREYWIINPQKNTIMVYDFENELLSNQYVFDDDISVCIYSDLVININKLIRGRSMVE